MAYVDLALSELQVKAVLAEAENDSNPRNRAMLLLAVKHAMRPSEVVNLKLADIDLKNNQITIERLKGSDENVQQISASEREALAAWMKVRDDKSAYVFTSRNGGQMNVSSYFRVYQSVAKRVGLPKNLSHPHCLRHSTAVLMLDNGASLPEVQRYLGHKSLASTGHYLRVSDKAANAKAAKALDKF